MAANVEEKIKVKKSRVARHKGDKDLDHLFGSFNSVWMEGFDYQLPSFTPGKGPYPIFTEKIITSYANRIPDEFSSAKINLLKLVSSSDAPRKRYRNTGLSNLKALIRRWLEEKNQANN